MKTWKLWFCCYFRFFAFKNQELKMWIAWLHLLCLDLWKKIFQGNEMAQFSETENSTSYTWGRQFYCLHGPSICFCFLCCPHLYTTSKCLEISSNSWSHCPSTLVTPHMHWPSTMLKAPFPLEVGVMEIMVLDFGELC